MNVRRLILAALSAALLLTALPAGAAAASLPRIGFGEQRSGIFSNPHWHALGLPDVRLVVGWDALRSRWQRREVDDWMRGADATNARVLVAFTRSRTYSRRRVLPSAKAYERQFLRFRERYPGVTDYLAWNEANHCSQPTCKRPDMAARYFDVMKSACRECRVVAADVLDTNDMVRWLRAFRRHARHEPRIWGLHNYIDANRFRTTGTRRMLRAVKGEIWFTETGGLVKRAPGSPHRFPESPSHAARATKWLFEKLIPMSSRIKRVYLYHFQNQGPKATWDSAILDPKGRPRPAYKVLARYLARGSGSRRPG